MLCLTLLCQLAPARLVRPFTAAPAVIAVAAQYLRIISCNFIGVSLVFACSGLFQALGDTRPALIGSAGRLLGFALPAIWLSQQPGFELRHVWYASVGSVLL